MTSTAPTPESRNDHRAPWETDPDAWKGEAQEPTTESMDAADALLAEVGAMVPDA